MPLKFNSQLNFIFKKNYKQIDYCFLGGEMVFLFLFFIDIVAQNYDFFYRHKIMKFSNGNSREKYFG